MDQSALIVFIKNFEPGKVKTRLAGTLGNQEALDVYVKLCRFTVEEVKKTGHPAWFYFSEYVDEAFLNQHGIDIHQSIYKARVQHGSNLGSRMNHAFREVMMEHEYGFILGTDCPYLNSKIIIDGLQRLERGDTEVVIGPAADGGYYGLGMNRALDVFSRIDWSTDRVLKQTINNLVNNNIVYSLLQNLNDIDYEEDWIHFKKSSSARYFEDVICANSFARDTEGE